MLQIIDLPSETKFEMHITNYSMYFSKCFENSNTFTFFRHSQFLSSGFIERIFSLNNESSAWSKYYFI